MKIIINFNNKETNTIERLVNKYAPISDECMKIEDDHYDRKFGVMDVKHRRRHRHVHRPQGRLRHRVPEVPG